MRHEDFALLLTRARELDDGVARLLAFDVQVPSAAGLAPITEPIATRRDFDELHCLSNADPRGNRRRDPG